MRHTIVIPMAPDSYLFPNKQSKSLYWGGRSTHRRTCREIAKKAAAKLGISPPLSGEVVVSIHARYGYRRRVPDLDATVAASKPFWDGVVDAGVLNDDSQIVRIVATHEKILMKPGDDPPKGETILTIEEKAGE